VHVGNHKRFGGATKSSINERAMLALDVLQDAYDRAVELECDGFIVCGDLFHHANPTPQLVAEMMRVLQPLTKPACSREMHIHLVAGNHELVSAQPGDHALATLAMTEGIHVYEHPTTWGWGVGKRGKVHVTMVPYRAGNAEDWLPEVMAEYVGDGHDSKRNILALHLGISDDDTSPYLRGAHDSIEATTLAALCRKHAIDFVFAGNWHDHRRWQMAWPDGGKENHVLKIIQLGALVPTGFNNPGLEGYGTLAIWDNGKVTLEELSGPRFVQLDASNADTAWLAEASEHYTMFTEDKVDDGAARVAAREAATAARSADTLQEALGAFVQRMPMEDGVDRKTVLARSKEYLAG
jgi:hypothetical protein